MAIYFAEGCLSGAGNPGCSRPLRRPAGRKSAEGMIVHSPADNGQTEGRPTRLAPLGRILRIAVDFLSDDALGRFAEVFVERVSNLQIFRPQSFVDERPWRS
jgi:hypothetical protein